MLLFLFANTKSNFSSCSKVHRLFQMRPRKQCTMYENPFCLLNLAALYKSVSDKNIMTSECSKGTVYLQESPIKTVSILHSN